MEKGKMKRILLGILFAILMLAILFSAYSIKPVKAAGTIYINADGSISPPEAPISSLDNITYTLTGDVTDSIVVQRSNITVDGAGHTVEGDGTGNGFTLQSTINVTIENTRIEGCIDGIQLFNSTDNMIIGNSLAGNNYEGVGVYYSSDNVITQNSITNNQVGVGAYNSSSNLIFDNNFINNTYQVYLENSVSVWDNGYPFGGNYWSDYTGNDFNSGPYQNVTGSDEKGDIPYVIDADNQDRYPIMNPYKFADLGGGVPPQLFYYDGRVDGKDLALFLQCYHGSVPPEAVSLADLGGGVPPKFYDYDRRVDGKDLALFLQCYHGQGPNR
jgi:parallel beta-helix repeat protein